MSQPCFWFHQSAYGRKLFATWQTICLCTIFANPLSATMDEKNILRCSHITVAFMSVAHNYSYVKCASCLGFYYGNGWFFIFWLIVLSHTCIYNFSRVRWLLLFSCCFWLAYELFCFNFFILKRNQPRRFWVQCTHRINKFTHSTLSLIFGSTHKYSMIIMVWAWEWWCCCYRVSSYHYTTVCPVYQWAVTDSLPPLKSSYSILCLSILYIHVFIIYSVYT